MTDTPTPQVSAPETDELEKLLDEATPGPWRIEDDTTCVWGGCDPDDYSDRGMGYPITTCRTTPISTWARGPDEDAGEANARLIALTPTLAAEVIALRAEVATLRASEARMREALALYSCADGCNDCPEDKRDRVDCGWTARAALQGGQQ